MGKRNSAISIGSRSIAYEKAQQLWNVSYSYKEGNYSTAFGAGAIAFGKSSISIGNESYVYASRSVGIGNEVQAINERVYSVWIEVVCWW